MTLVDDDGYLFGRVNVIDAAVVLVVLVAVAAGIFFLNPFASQGDPATRYATVDLGEQPRAVAERISAGDVSPGDTAATDLTIVDTYVGPGGPGNATVIVSARINGTADDSGGEDLPGVTFRDGILQRGDEVDVETREYDVEGRILELSRENASLDTGSLPVVVETNVSGATAAQIEPGDTYRIDERAVATVEETVIAPSGPAGNRTALLGLSLTTVEYSGDTYFGHRKVLVGETLRFETDRYELAGPVVRWNSAVQPGEPTNTTAVVKLSSVRPDVADGLEAGMTERHDGRTYARILETRTRPATVVLTSDDGNIFERDHPVRQDAFLTVDLRARRTDDGLRFHARPLREGANVTLDFRTISVQGTVVDLEE